MYSPSLLLIEADEAVRHDLLGQIREQGWRASVARCGEEAADSAKAERFDLAMVAWEQPGRSTLEALKKLRAHDPNAEVVLVTESIDAGELIRAMRLGVRDCLLKPVAPEELRRVLEEWRRRRELSGRVAEETRRLEAQADQMRRQLDDLNGNGPGSAFGGIISQSEAMRRVRQAAMEAAGSRQPVLLVGEAGVGKETIARAIHKLSSPANDPESFIKLGLESLADEQQQQSELFGNESPDGGGRRKPGRLELAGEGTLLLKQATALGRAVQRKLAAALRQGRFRRIGGERDIPLRARVIFTLRSRNASEVPGELDEELAGLLEGRVIEVPPLRERLEDLPMLAKHFLTADSGGASDGAESRLDRELLVELLNRDWAGNVAELERTLRNSGAGGAFIAPRHESMTSEEGSESRNGSRSESLNGRGKDNHELARVVAALTQARWNQRKAARLLGISYSSLRRRVAKYQLKDRWAQHVSPAGRSELKALHEQDFISH